MLYRTTNKSHNSDKLGFLFLGLSPTIVWFYNSDYDLARVITVTSLDIILAIGILIWYRLSSFELIFYADKIIYQMSYSTKKIELDYSDLAEVHSFEYLKQSDSNIFIFVTKTSKLKLRTDLVEKG